MDEHVLVKISPVGYPLEHEAPLDLKITPPNFVSFFRSISLFVTSEMTWHHPSLPMGIRTKEEMWAGFSSEVPKCGLVFFDLWKRPLAPESQVFFLLFYRFASTMFVDNGLCFYWYFPWFVPKWFYSLQTGPYWTSICTLGHSTKTLLF